MLCKGFYSYKYWVFATGYTICDLALLRIQFHAAALFYAVSSMVHCHFAKDLGYLATYLTAAGRHSKFFINYEVWFNSEIMYHLINNLVDVLDLMNLMDFINILEIMDLLKLMDLLDLMDHSMSSSCGSSSYTNALQNYSAVNCFENSITKVILCLKA